MAKPIEVVEQVYKSVKVGTKTKIKFEAKDGKQFDTEEQALEHEKKLDFQEKFNRIKWVETSTYYNYLADDERWYYIADQENLDTLIIHIRSYKYCYKYLNGLDYHNNSLNIGDWITFKYTEGGDYSHDILRIYTLDYVLKEMFDFLLNFPGKSLEELEKEIKAEKDKQNGQ